MRPDEAALASRLIDRSLLSMVFQPIVDLRAGKIFGYEALSRPQVAEFKSPPELARAALSAGRVGELGRLQRRLAVRNCQSHPLFLNIDPNEFDQPWLVRADDPVFSHKWPVFLEITEAVPLHYFDQCQSVLAELRSKGALLAIDDLGAGFSNLKYIVDLKPDIVKLDRNLVAGAKPGSRQFQLLRSLAELCHEMGARVVAEGIEEIEELQTAALAGVDYCQGYLLARPAAPPPAMAWPRDEKGSVLDEQGLARYCEEYHRLSAAGVDQDPSDSVDVPSGGDAGQRIEALESALKWARAESRKAEARVETAEASSQRLRNQVTALRDALAESERSRQQLVAQVRRRSSGAAEALAGTKPGTAREAGASATFRQRMAGLVAGVSALLRPRDRSDRRTGPGGRGQPLSTLRLGALAAVVTAGFLLLLVPVYRMVTGGNRPAEIAQGTQPPAARPEVPAVEVELERSGTLGGRGMAEAPEPLPGAEKPEPALAVETVSVPSPREEEAPPAVDQGAITRAEVEERVLAWAQAWSSRRVEDYLSFYADGFLPAGGASREQWEVERRSRLPAPQWIRVTLEELAVDLEGEDRALARFRQVYESDRYGDTVRKILELVFEGGEWKILRETSEQI